MLNNRMIAHASKQAVLNALFKAQAQDNPAPLDFSLAHFLALRRRAGAGFNGGENSMFSGLSATAIKLPQIEVESYVGALVEASK